MLTRKLLAFLLLLSAAFAVVSVTTGGPYNPGASVSYTITGPVGGNVSVGIIHPNSTNASNAQVVLDGSGSYSGSYQLASLAQNGTWSIFANDTDDDAHNSATFAVGVAWTVPTISASASSVTLDKGNQTNVTLTITNNVNNRETILITNSTCASISSHSLNASSVTLDAGFYTNVNLTIIASQTSGSCTITLTAAHQPNSNTNASAGVALTVNPTHNFVLNKSNDGQSGETSVSYNLTLNNTGEAGNTFTLSANTSACSINPTTPQAVEAGKNYTYAVTISIPSNAALNQWTSCNITVTDNYGKIDSTSFVATAASRYGVVVSGNSTHYAWLGDNYGFNVTVNNTGNMNDVYNLTVTIGSWNATFSNGTSSFVGLSNSTLMTLPVASLSANNTTLTVSVPANATACASTGITVAAVSRTNASKTASFSTTVKLPCFTITPALVFSTNTSMLNLTIASVVRDGTALAAGQIQALNYTIRYSNGSLANYSAIPFNTTFQINASNLTCWPLETYTFNATVVDTNGRSGSSSGVFRLVTATYISASAPVTSIATSTAFTITVISRYNSVSGGDFAPATPSLSGGSCTTAAGTYAYSCSFTSTGTQSVLVSNSLATCLASGNLTCTLTPTLSASGSFTITVTASTTQNNQQNNNQQSSDSSNDTDDEETTSADEETAIENLTAAEKNVGVELPSTNATTWSLHNFTISLVNNNSESVRIEVRIDEQGNYSHFTINFTAPESIAANSNASLALSATPYKYARPGTYSAIVLINSISHNLTLVVPEPQDNKSVHRYVEIAKNGSESVVILELRNLGNYSKNITVVETIPKSIANSTAELVLFNSSRYRYRIINDDPVIEWNASLAPGARVEVKYSVRKDLKNATFVEPNVTETGGGEEAEKIAYAGAIVISDMLKTIVIIGAIAIAFIFGYAKRVRIRMISPGIRLPKLGGAGGQGKAAKALRSGIMAPVRGGKTLARRLREWRARRQQHAKEEPKHVEEPPKHVEPEKPHAEEPKHVEKEKPKHDEPGLTPYERALRKTKE